MAQLAIKNLSKEIESDFDCELLNIPGYRFECEINNVKRRVGSYIKNSIKYDRGYLLEGENNHLLIIDIDNGLKKAKRIINIYRSFNPNGITERDLFERQLTFIKNAFTSDSILLGVISYLMRTLALVSGFT